MPPLTSLLRTWLASHLNYVILGCYLVLAGLLYAIVTVRVPPFLHPDGIYQSYEPAHYFFYGYGELAWEWKVGGWQTVDRPEGYGPIRSMITPFFFMALYWVGETLSLDYWTQTLLLVRVVMVLFFLAGLGVAAKLTQTLEADTTPSHAGLLFAVFALGYTKFYFNATAGFTNTMILPLTFGALLLFILPLDKKWYRWPAGLVGGFLVGLSIWVRPDTAVLMAFFVLMNLDRFRVWKVPTFSAGFLLSAVFNGFLDQLQFGQFFVTFPNFIAFNSVNQALFGTKPFGWYLETLLTAHRGMGFLLVLSTLTYVVLIVVLVYKKQQGNHKQVAHLWPPLKLLTRLAFWFVLTLVWWETNPHKERRFIIGTEVVLLIWASVTVAFLVSTSYKWLQANGENFRTVGPWLARRKQTTRNYLYLLVLLPPILGLFLGGSAQTALTTGWNSGVGQQEALMWVGQQEDVMGVGILEPMWYNGGYTFLHQNVSLIYFLRQGGNEVNQTHLFNEGRYGPYLYARIGRLNYLIIPQHQYWEFPTVKNATVEAGFELVWQATSDLTYTPLCDVWYYNPAP